jgi:hypothetical protein
VNAALSPGAVIARCCASSTARAAAGRFAPTNDIIACASLKA